MSGGKQQKQSAGYQQGPHLFSQVCLRCSRVSNILFKNTRPGYVTSRRIVDAWTAMPVLMILVNDSCMCVVCGVWCVCVCAVRLPPIFTLSSLMSGSFSSFSLLGAV